MTVGQVVRWNNFPHAKDRAAKPRFFIFVGKFSYGATNQNIYLYTTTTKSEYYEAGEIRDKHLTRSFGKGEFGFTEACILDIDLGWHIVQEHEIRNNPKIETVGQLPERISREIYELIWKSRSVPLAVKRDIYSSYNLAGITGLRVPQRF